ncbi:MAG TPA: FHA domain-containing protein [Ktedonobacteraceae bacterium]|nr:FHA domain-containing protein [Ktedonobacteraceae bacterium]
MKEDIGALASITFMTGPLKGQTISIQKPVTTIGREPSNDIVIRNDLKVSRYHARLILQDGNWHIEKTSQSSFLLVNQQKVQQSPLADKSVVNLGDDTSFVFRAAPAGQMAGGPTAFSDPAAQRPTPLMPPAQGFTPVPPGPPAQPFTPAPLPVPPGPPGPPRVGTQAGPAGYPPAAPPPAYSQAPVTPYSVDGQTARAPGAVARPDATVVASLESIGLPSLEITSYSHSEKKVYVLDKPALNIGRDPTNDIIINDRIVSGLHLRVVRQGNTFVLIHPHPERPRTLNGLLYQGRKIRGDEQFSHVLSKGDIFRIGDENGTLVTLTYNDGTGTAQDILPAMQPIKLGAAELTIGRRPDNAVVLAHPQVSAHHARLIQEGGTYRIVDQNSMNHVYVNAELVTSHLLRLGDEIRIGPYKLIFEGNQLSQYDESNFIRIDAQNLRKSGNNNITLLNNISITIPPRKFVALVGGSGAGKSTLMDALNGLRPAQQGKVFYNGQDYYHNLSAFSTLLGYVPQDDIVHRDLTVERALYYAAKFRLPGDFTNEQIEQRIVEVLEDVEMTSRRKLLVKKLSGGQRKRVSIAMELLANPSLFFLDEPTSGLDPGLDRKMMYLLRKLADAGHTIVLVTHATNNINACDYVCFLAQGGRLAFFGSPEEAKAYFGKTDFAEIYTTLEPSDENPNVPDEAEARFKLSREYQAYIAEPPKTLPEVKAGGVNGQAKNTARRRRGNPLQQFLLLSLRNFELLKNNRSNLVILLLQAPLIALLLMLLVRFEVGVGLFDGNKVVQCSPRIFTSQAVSQTNPSGLLGIDTKGNNAAVDCNRIVSFLKTDASGISYAKSKGGVDTALQDFIVQGVGLNAARALFIIAFVAVLFGVINGTREVVKEASIYRRERTVNLGIFPYVFSKVLVFGLFSVFQSAALLLIVYAFEPFQRSIFLPVLLEIYITLLLTALAGLMIGLTASTFAANEDSANSLLPFILIPQVVFAGVEIPLKDWPLQIAAVVFPTRWSVAALGSSVGLHSDKLGGDSLFGSDSTFHGTLFSTFTTSDAVHRLVLSWGALGALIVALIIVMCIGLKRKDVRF